MSKSQLYIVSGPNAAGKSSFIRSRLNDFSLFEVIMTDVYRERTKDIFYLALDSGKSIVLETVFNDSSSIKFVEDAQKKGYETNLIFLFLNTPQQSLNRVAARYLEQNGLEISKGNVDVNFNLNFKHITQYFFYFDRSDFIYTGETDRNESVMSFRKMELFSYRSNPYTYVQVFAQHAFQHDRLDTDALEIIKANKDFIKN